MKITDIIRTGQVVRWNLVRTHREQTIGEHMYQVAMIARQLAPIVDFACEFIDRHHVMMFALEHDLEETKTGDMPTPTKQYLSKYFKEDINLVLNEIFWGLDARELASAEVALVKVADLMEAIFFLETEGIGSHAKYVQKSLISRIKQMVVGLEIKYPNIFWQKAMDHMHVVLKDLKSGDY